MERGRVPRNLARCDFGKKAMKQVARKALRALSPSRVVIYRNEKRIVQAFGEEHGLVYFGHVSNDNEYAIVRGLTLSNQHRDLHYCVGSYSGYDVAFVERSDTLLSPTKKTKNAHRWHIMEFDLHTKQDLPHVFIGLHSHSESFYMQLFTKYPHLRMLSLGHTGNYPAEFTEGYRVYGKPAQLLDVEAVITPEIAGLISRHFGRVAIEIHDGSLYLYSENLHVSMTLLDAMLKNGVWLAKHLDAIAEQHP